MDRRILISAQSQGQPPVPPVRSLPISSMKRRCARYAWGSNRVKQEPTWMESVEVISAGYQRKGAGDFSARKRRSWHTTRSATPWLRQSRPIPLPCRRLRLFPEPAAHWAIPCRWMRANKYADEQGGAVQQDCQPLPAGARRRS